MEFYLKYVVKCNQDDQRSSGRLLTILSTCVFFMYKNWLLNKIHREPINSVFGDFIVDTKES